MKKPTKELVDAFFTWFRADVHAQREGHYDKDITHENLSKLPKKDFIEFFFQFARDGGMVQSGGARTAPRFRAVITDQYDAFRKFVLQPFKDGFDELAWLDHISEFRFLGIGLATIFLNRVDRRRFAIINNKSDDWAKLLDVEVPSATAKRYQAIRDAQKQLIDWFPDFENFFRTDALTQFLVAEEAGEKWAEQLRGKVPDVGGTYWVYAPGDQARQWEQYLKAGEMGIGWDAINRDLSGQTEAELRQIYEEMMPDDDKSEVDFQQLCDFVLRMKPGDKVFVKHGRSAIVGYGEVTSGYFYDPQRPEYRHMRKSKWEKVGRWSLPEEMTILPMKTLTEYSDSARIAELLGVINERTGGAPGGAAPAPVYSLDQFAAETHVKRAEVEKWVAAAQRKKQVIFYGPPGTGKTFVAQRLAQHLIGGSDGFSEIVQFHPSYAYEDFMQGLKPKALKDGGLEYAMVPGRFKVFCDNARTRSGPCVLLIDEINRANLARVLGELMFLLEYRRQSISLAGGDQFTIPNNAVIVGTMNTADRSIALVDHALRRRFAFVGLYPNYDILKDYHRVTAFDPSRLIGVLERLNAAIGDKHYAVGASFFLGPQIETTIQDIWQMEIEPYIEELFFDQPNKAESFGWEKVGKEILGT